MMGLAVSAGGCGEGGTGGLEAPVARVEATELVIHGTTRVDDYYWLNERENPDVARTVGRTAALLGDLDALVVDLARAAARSGPANSP